MHHIPDDVFLIAARELAASVRDEDLEQGSLYPPLSAIREVSLKIAVGITKYAYCKGECWVHVGWRHEDNHVFIFFLVFLLSKFYYFIIAKQFLIQIYIKYTILHVIESKLAMNIETKGLAVRYPAPTCEELRGDFFDLYDYSYKDFEHISRVFPYPPPPEEIRVKPLDAESIFDWGSHVSMTESRQRK